MNVRLAIPLLIQEGWLRHQEKDAKPPQRRRRGGRDCRSVSECALFEEVPRSTTPSAPLKEASRLLLDVASTPPVSGGELPASIHSQLLKLIHSFLNDPDHSGQRPPPVYFLIQRKHHQCAAEVGVIGKLAREADGAEAFGSLSKTFRQSDRGPAADAGEHGDKLLTVVHVSYRVADNSGWSVELIQHFPGRLIHCLEPAVQCPVEDQTAVCGQCSAVDLECFVD